MPPSPSAQTQPPVKSWNRWIGVGIVLLGLLAGIITFWSEIWTASVPFIIAIVLAYILNPAVGWLQRTVCRGRRVPAVALLFLMVLLVVVPGTIVVATVLAGEVFDLLGRATAAIEIQRTTAPVEGVEQPMEFEPSAESLEPKWYMRWVPDSVREVSSKLHELIRDETVSWNTIAQVLLEATAEASGMEVDDLLAQIREQAPGAAVQAAKEGMNWTAWGVRQLASATTFLTRVIVKAAGGTMRLLMNTIVIVIVLFYALIDIDRFGWQILRFVPPVMQNDFLRIWKAIDAQWSAFLRGQFSVAIVVGILGAVLYPLAGVDFGILIGLFAGLCNVVPYLGPAMGAALAFGSTFIEQIPNGLAALLTQSIAVIVVFSVIQWLEGFVITPTIMSDAIEMHPMSIFFGLVIGGSIAGVVGMLVAVPGMCAIRILVRELYLKPLQQHALESGIGKVNSISDSSPTEGNNSCL